MMGAIRFTYIMICGGDRFGWSTTTTTISVIVTIHYY